MKIYFFLLLIFSVFGLHQVVAFVETEEARLEAKAEKLCSMYPPKTFSNC